MQRMTQDEQQDVQQDGTVTTARPATPNAGPPDAASVGSGGPCGSSSRAPRPAPTDERGSMVSEYGLVAVLGATIAGIAISWAKGGAVVGLLTAVLGQLRAVVAA